MADAIFTEEQHVSLLETAVTRETAALTASNQELAAQVEVLTSEKSAATTENVELQNRIDVLESEKAAEVTRADNAVQALTDFQNELSEKAAVEERKATRVAAIQAADSTLDETYFTDARKQRWAEMSDEHFDALVEDLTEAASKKTVTTTEDAGEAVVTPQVVRESAAFKGGEAPTAVGVSAVRALFQVTGKLPVSN